jgi:type IX secretion system PorP/SprF family membrane protein
MFLLVLNVKSQDPHYTLINTQPLVLNPALTGVFDFDFKHKDIRFASLYRQQWTTVASNYASTAKPYHTTSLSIDGLLKRDKQVHGDYIGAGLSLMYDRAGDLNLTTQQVTFSTSYNKSLNTSKTKFLTLGFQGGFANRSVNHDNAFYDNQWTGVDFNPDLPTGESFPTSSFSFTDFSVGAVYEKFEDFKPKYMIGVAYFHVNTPTQVFYDNSAANLGQKLNIHGQLDYPIGLNTSIVTHLVFSSQRGEMKTNLGGYYKIKVYEQKQMKNSYYFGGGARITGSHEKILQPDAVFVAYKMSMGDFLWGVAYDVNISKLNRASQTFGAFEISLMYYRDLYKPNHKPKKHRSKYKAECPDDKR